MPEMTVEMSLVRNCAADQAPGEYQEAVHASQNARRLTVGLSNMVISRIPHANTA
jgi:hypothetical protein